MHDPRALHIVHANHILTKKFDIQLAHRDWLIEFSSKNLGMYIAHVLIGMPSLSADACFR